MKRPHSSRDHITEAELNPASIRGDIKRSIRTCIRLAVLGLASVVFSAGDIHAAAPFYEGKVLTLIQGCSAGGLGDLRVCAAIPYLQKYLPGNPQIVFHYVAGAGGIQAANQMATTVAKDGLTIANIGTSIFTSAIARESIVKYGIDDCVYLGAASVGGPYALLVRPMRPKTVSQLRNHEKLRIAERSVGHTIYNVGRIIAFVLELKEPRWITGYSSPEVDMALERGEADAQTEVIFDLMQRKPKWRQQGFTVPVVLKNIKGRGPDAAAAFPQTETVNDYADTQLKKDVLRFYYNSRPGSSVFFAPKGIPNDALAALRLAFQKLWNDSQFLKEYERGTGEPAEPITGEEIEKFLKEIPNDPKVRTVVQQLAGPDALPAAR